MACIFGTLHLAILVLTILIRYSSKKDPTDDDFITLATIPDTYLHKQASQTNYSVPITVPNKVFVGGSLRVRYHPNKPTEPIFRQCADITISAKTQSPVLGLLGFSEEGAPSSSQSLPVLVKVVDGGLSPVAGTSALMERFTLQDGIAAIDNKNHAAFYLAQENNCTESLPANHLVKFDTDASTLSYVGEVSPPSSGQWTALLGSGSHGGLEKSLLGVSQVQTADGNFTFQVHVLDMHGQEVKVLPALAQTVPETEFVNFLWAEFDADKVHSRLFLKSNPKLQNCVV